MESVTIKFTIHKEIAAGLAAIVGGVMFGTYGLFAGAGIVCAAFHVLEVRKINKAVKA